MIERGFGTGMMKVCVTPGMTGMAVALVQPVIIGSIGHTQAECAARDVVPFPIGQDGSTVEN